MSVASASRTIKFITKSGTYTAWINSPSGDLYQFYTGDETNVGTVTPDYTVSANQPTLYFVCTSSRTSEGIANVAAISWYFNGTLLSFSSTTNLSTGTYAGLFQKVYPDSDDGQYYYGLKIVGNLVESAGCASATIKAVATVTSGTVSDSITATYTVRIQKYSSDSYFVTIVAGDTNNFMITTDGGTCKLKAMVYKGSDSVTPDGYQWAYADGDEFVDISGATAQTYSVQEADVATSGMYRVTVTIDGVSYSDIQRVDDTTDPYDINPGADPADETIEEGSSAAYVNYTPTVVKRGSTTQASGTYVYDFLVTDAYGVKVASSTSVAQGTAYQVTEDMCANGDVCLVITANEA